METKTLEIRDAATFIPVLAMQVSGDDGYLVRRAGYGNPIVILMRLNGCDAHYNPMEWNNGRTLQVAHKHIEEHWDELESEMVIDVEYIMGVTNEPKISERFTA